MKRFLYIAVVYNNISVTRDLCQSLVLQKPGDYSISLVLVDNSDIKSSQQEIDFLVRDLPFATVFRPQNNLGYFPAISAALTLYAHDYDFVIAGNNDIKYAEDFSIILSNSTYEDSTMVVCPDVVTADGIHQNPHHKYSISRLERLYFDLYFSNYISAILVSKIKLFLDRLEIFKNISTLSIRGDKFPQEIDQGVGAVYILTSKFLQFANFKLYYPAFLYGEEACISWQVRSYGGNIWYDPSLKVWHAESASLNKISKFISYKYARDSYWKIRNILR